MSRAGGRLAGCLLLVSAAGCAERGARAPGGRREIAVEADGWAPIAGADVLSARRRALAEAEKKAVEKAVGVTVRARTRVDDAINVQQSIEANLGGTIRRYEVLSEGPEAGFFKMRIRASVVCRPLEDAKPAPAPPRVSVRVANEKVAGAVRAALLARDYDTGDDGAAADVAVTGMVELHELADPRLGGYYSYDVKVSLTAAIPRTGKVVRVESAASAVDVDEDEARDEALEKAGDDCGAALASSLAEGGAPAVAAVPQR